MTKKTHSFLLLFATRLRSKMPECWYSPSLGPNRFLFPAKARSTEISKSSPVLLVLLFLIFFAAVVVAALMSVLTMIVEKIKGDGAPPLHAPRYKLVPGDDALATAIPAHAHGAPEVLRNTPVPTGLANRAVDRVDVSPPLIGRDLRQVRRRERATVDGDGICR